MANVSFAIERSYLTSIACRALCMNLLLLLPNLLWKLQQMQRPVGFEHAENYTKIATTMSTKLILHTDPTLLTFAQSVASEQLVQFAVFC